MFSNTSLKVMSRKVPLPERAAARSCLVSGLSSRISMLSTTSSCSSRFSSRHSGLQRVWGKADSHSPGSWTQSSAKVSPRRSTMPHWLLGPEGLAGIWAAAGTSPLAEPQPPHVVSTSKTSTEWCEARARPLSVMMVGGAMLRWMHTSCTALTTATEGIGEGRQPGHAEHIKNAGAASSADEGVA